MTLYWQKLFDIHKIPYNNELLREINSLYEYKQFDCDIYIPTKYMTGGYNYINKKEGINIEIFKTEDKHGIKYSIQNKAGYDCLLIDVSPDSDIAYISNISTEPECRDNNKLLLSGSIILDIAISFLKNTILASNIHKKDIKIKYIKLTDNSRKKINNVTINMSALYTLEHGITWYMSRGFVPSDNNSLELYKPHKSSNNGILKQKMDDNKKIMDELTFENSKILNYLNKFLKDTKGLTSRNIDDINYLIKIVSDPKNKNHKLKNLFRYIHKNSNKYSSLLYFLTEDYYHKLKLYNFYGKVFILQIR